MNQTTQNQVPTQDEGSDSDEREGLNPVRAANQLIIGTLALHYPSRSITVSDICADAAARIMAVVADPSQQQWADDAHPDRFRGLAAWGWIQVDPGPLVVEWTPDRIEIPGELDAAGHALALVSLARQMVRSALGDQPDAASPEPPAQEPAAKSSRTRKPPATTADAKPDAPGRRRTRKPTS